MFEVMAMKKHFVLPPFPATGLGIFPLPDKLTFTIQPLQHLCFSIYFIHRYSLWVTAASILTPHPWPLLLRQRLCTFLARILQFALSIILSFALPIFPF